LNPQHLSIQLTKKKAVTENELPKLRDRTDYQERMKALQDIQIDPDTARDPQLRNEVVRKRAELIKQAREQGLIESWAVVNKSNKVIKMFESKKLAYDYVIENIFESDYKVVRRNELKEYGATSTGSPTSTPGASAVPTPKQPTTINPPSSAKPTPVTPPAATAAVKPGANSDVDELAQAAARDPKMAAQLKAMAAQAKTGR
jgi:ribosome-binding protein aMBF1 (putative translation factor)